MPELEQMAISDALQLESASPVSRSRLTSHVPVYQISTKLGNAQFSY